MIHIEGIRPGANVGVFCTDGGLTKHIFLEEVNDTEVTIDWEPPAPMLVFFRVRLLGMLPIEEVIEVRPNTLTDVKIKCRDDGGFAYEWTLPQFIAYWLDRWFL